MNWKFMCLSFAILFSLFFLGFYFHRTNNLPFSEPSELNSSDIMSSSIFNGMSLGYAYTQFDLTTRGSTGYRVSTASYSYISGSDYHVNWYGGHSYQGSWSENAQDRIISGYQSQSINNSPFRTGGHTPFWIFTDISLGDTIPIAIRGNSADHQYKVTNEFQINDYYFGRIDLWVLEDLADSRSVVWYEKSTGVLLRGDFFHGNYKNSYRLERTNAPITLALNWGIPELISGSANPLSIVQNGSFNFSVVYRDPDNFYPSFINLLLDGKSYPLTQKNPGDHNYKDGSVYQLSLFLPLGDHIYSFECSDGLNYVSTITKTVCSITDQRAPKLIPSSNLPENGVQNTLLNFSVVYSDQNNDPPTYLDIMINGIPYAMEKRDPFDINYTDGCLYQYFTISTPGNYTYSFRYSDGLHSNSTQIYNLHVTPYVTKPAIPEPVSYWNFDEDSGTTAYDTQGLNDATLFNMDDANRVPGISGNGLDFDGRNDYLYCGHDWSLKISGDLSIEFWLNATVLNGARLIIYGGAGETTATNVQYGVILNTDGTFLLLHEYGSGSNQFFYTTNSYITAGTWYHVVIVRNDTSKEWLVYIDGEYKETVRYTYSATGGASGSLWIGSCVGGAYFFNGRMDEVRIYNSPLNSSEVSNLYDAYKNSPFLKPISPNPDEDGIIALNWSKITNAIRYNIYRDVNPITSIDHMMPIGIAYTNSYQDIITTPGVYYYVIVANSALGNSSISNCENVTVTLQKIWNYTAASTINSMAISANGGYVVGSSDSKVYLFNTSSGSLVWQSADSYYHIHSVAISADGSDIVVGTNNYVVLYNKGSSSPVWRYDLGEKVEKVAVSADGSCIVAGTDELKLYFFYKNSSSPIWRYLFYGDVGHHGEVCSLAISDDGNYIAWSLSMYCCVCMHGAGLLNGTGNWIYGDGDTNYGRTLTTISGDGSTMVVGNVLEGQIALWRNDITSATPLWDYSFGTTINSVGISADGSYIVVGCGDNNLFLFRRANSNPLWNYVMDGSVNSVDITADGSYVLAGSADGLVYAFSRNSSTPLWNYSMNGAVELVAMSQDGASFAVVSGDTVTFFQDITSNLPSIVPESEDPPNAPVLNSLMSLDTDGLINLNWSDIENADIYYVYRDTPPIVSVDGTSPLTTVSTSNYQDQIYINDVYYYAIVAGNEWGNSSLSNCENFTVAIPPLAPILESILPNPNLDGIIDLYWSDSSYATTYYVYRANFPILVTTGLTSIACVTGTSYQDVVNSYGNYDYAIVAGNLGGNSSLSNCESITVVITPLTPTLEPISPNPNQDGFVDLNWSEGPYATIYYIYRANFSFMTIDTMTPIARVSESAYQDAIGFNGTYYYVIIAGNLGGNSSLSNCESVIVAIPPPNDFAPSLNAGLVTPNTGNQLTQFELNINYVDQDNNPPASINVLINGTSYPMGKVNGSDFNYRDGCRYQYSTQLSPGIYYYSFECNDGTFSNAPILTNQKFVVYDVNNPSISEIYIFQPFEDYNITPTIFCIIQISSPGINLSSVQYAYSTTGSQAPTNWVPVDGIYLDPKYTIPAHDGATGLLYVKITTVPFNQYSQTENTIRFRATDLANNEVVSEVVIIEISEEIQPPPMILIIIVILGALATGSCSGYILVHKRVKEKRIQDLLMKVLNVPRGSFCASPLPTEEPRIITYNSAEIPAPPVDELEVSNEPTEDNLRTCPPRIGHILLFKVLFRFTQLFPSLAEFFPEEKRLRVVMDLRSLPDGEIFEFFAALLRKVSGKDVRTQICAVMNELNNSEDYRNWKPVLNNIAQLILLADSSNNQNLLNNILQLVVFIKYAPEGPFEVPIQVPVALPPAPPIEEIPLSEMLIQMSLRLEKLKRRQDNRYLILTCRRIEKLIDMVISLNDLRLLNDLLRLLDLLERS